MGPLIQVIGASFCWWPAVLRGTLRLDGVGGFRQGADRMAPVIALPLQTGELLQPQGDGFFFHAFYYNVQVERGAELQSRSEEHTSELQSRPHLVCRLLLEK